MGLMEPFGGLRRPWKPGHLLLVIPLALIVIIVTVDILTPRSIDLGPLLVVAPALTASFASSRWTAAFGALAAMADVLDGWKEGSLGTREKMVGMLALLAVSAFVVLFCAIRERRQVRFEQVRSVSEAAQQVVLQPLPRRAGPLCITSMYLAAAAEAQIGGDLYAAARVGDGTRFIIGDVRGNGLASIRDAAALLCAFREAAHRHVTLCTLATHLEDRVSRHLAERAETNANVSEGFITASLIEVPDAEPTLHVVSCGHPPPLILRGDRVLVLQPEHVAPPLGLGALAAYHPRSAAFAFRPGDILLLYTDGIIEARDRRGDFYDLPGRLRTRAGDDIDTLVRRLRDDLLDHVGGRMEDDTAVIAVERLRTGPDPVAGALLGGRT